MQRRSGAIAGLLALLSGCSTPVMFAIFVDEKVEGGTLTLNGKSARLMQNVDGAYWGRWDGSDASGSIEIRYPDGAVSRCPVGYVTHDMGVQRFSIQHRKCAQIGI